MRFLLALLGILTPAPAAVWLPPSAPQVSITDEKPGAFKITSATEGAYTIESAERFSAQPGDAFEVNVSIRVGLNTRALPELACYDASGKEIPTTSSLATGPDFSTTNWQRLKRIFPALPGAVSVRARLRASGRGEILAADLEFRPVQVDPYRTGALISQLYPNRRRGLVLESNRGLVNRALVTGEDRDGDGKWALVTIDLDEISKPGERGTDWRTGFEYRPNEIYWSDGAVLKSDSVLQDREPDTAKALHVRTRVYPGDYHVVLNDPGRAIAVSLDGVAWRRYAGGQEAELGLVQAPGGTLELWVDACYRDPVTAGPAYFDYLRLLPADDPVSVKRLAAAARQKPVERKQRGIDEKSVVVSVEGARFTGGGNWPVRCGLPIPRGELASAERVAVFAQDGSKVPAQSRSMATWPDGTVKWLHLDFPHDFSTSASGRYVIRYGNRVQPFHPRTTVQVRRAPEGLEVDTGALRFRVPGSRFGILENVSLSSGMVVQREPISVEILEAGGRAWRALDLPLERLEIEQAGPYHAVIVAETRFPESGKPAQGFAHRARIHAYAGSPLVQVDYFVANTDSRSERRPDWLGGKLDVRSISLRLRPGSRVQRVAHPFGAGSPQGAFVQKDAGRVLLESGEANSPSPAGINGWAAFALERGGIAVGIEAFREQYPKAIRWRPDEIELALWAEEGGAYEWNEGVSKTHRISLQYGDAGVADASLVAAGPALAVAEPEWYAASGAMGATVPSGSSPRPGIEKTLAASMRGVIQNVGLGFENYGDHSSPGYVRGTVAWANNEYDQPAAGIHHFARTGDRDALRIGLASALHFLDVDMCHYSSLRADWLGAARVHGHGIIGHHTAEAPNMHHAGDIQGLILYSYFTGDPAGLNGAEGVARWVLRNMNPRSNVGSMERALGHPLMTLVDVYEATWNETYLLGAARLVDWSLKWEHPDRGGYLAPITESPAFYSGSPFCGGLLSAGLVKFNSWAKLPEIDRMLERVARWLLTEMWRPPANLIHKGGPPRAAAGAQPRHISSHLRLMAHAFERTGDPLFLVVPAASVETAFGAGARPFGYRNSGLVFNYLPQFLHTLAAQGNPAPEPNLRIEIPGEIRIRKGAEAEVCFAVQNTGIDVVDDLKLSFQTRLELGTGALAPVPGRLAPGEHRQICAAVRAPEWLNLTSESGRHAFSHLSALYRRAGTAHSAHAWTKIVLEAELVGRIPKEDDRKVNPPNTDTRFVMPRYRSLAEWEARKAHLRKQILSAAGLLPMPEKAPLHPEIFGRIARKDYSVEKVLLETLPGYYLGGNLYRPIGKPGPHPAVVSPHGHWTYGRIENDQLVSVPARCISLARQGYVVFTYDQVGHNDTTQTSHDFNRPAEQLWSFSPLGLQLWNSIRVVDFLQSLEEVDPDRIAATGASSGATQTFLLTAVDERVKFSAPVSMISAFMQGGSTCTTAPSLNFGTFNVEIGALMAPRPMLIVSNTGDWTRNTPRDEFPAIREIYELYGKGGNVENVHVDAPHNYNRASREAAYRFFGKHMLPETDGAKFSEGEVRVEQPRDLLVLHGRTLPAGALSYEAIFENWKAASRRQAGATQDLAALRERLSHAFGAEWPDQVLHEITGERIVLSRAGRRDRVPGLWLDHRERNVALVVHPDGAEAARGLLPSKHSVLLLDVFQTGGAIAPRNQSRRDFLTYNRSDDANRVQDILTGLKFLKARQFESIELIGIGQAGVWCLFAAALAPVELRLSADLDGFDGSDDAFLKRFFVPGIQRAGGLETAVRLTRDRGR